MGGAGGQDGAGPRRDFKLLAAVTTEADPRVAAGDAERFMDRRVVVQIIVDAVAPHIAPAIGAEQSLDGLFGMRVIDRDRLLINQKRQPVVRDEAVVLQDKSERFDGGADDHLRSRQDGGTGFRGTADSVLLGRSANRSLLFGSAERGLRRSQVGEGGSRYDKEHG